MGIDIKARNDMDFRIKIGDNWAKQENFTSMYSTQAALEPRTGLKASPVLLPGNNELCKDEN